MHRRTVNYFGDKPLIVRSTSVEPSLRTLLLVTRSPNSESYGMENQQTSNASITLHQLGSGTWNVPIKHWLRSVQAVDELGTVKVWGSQCQSWSWVAEHPPLSTAPDTYFDLLVQGCPKTVASALVVVQAFDRGLFEAPISMTLAHGLNWVHRWTHGERSEKAEVLDHLYRMAECAYRCLNYDRYHFSKVAIKGLLSVIDASIVERDRPTFVQNIEKLNGLKEMNYDPQSGSFGSV